MPKNQFINVPVSKKFKDRVEACAEALDRSAAWVMRAAFELWENELASIPSTLVGVDSTNSKLGEVVERDDDS